MPRWIAFDPVSAAAIGAVLQAPPELHRDDALGSALASTKPAVLLAPSDLTGRALIADIRWTTMDDLRPVAYEITGFLGLVDQPIYEEEPAQPKKWWQKILE